jgi:HNH endonuclease
MINPGEVISYLDMCQEEGANLQRGMNFHFRGSHSVILMSLRPGAPYADRVEENGRVLIYEGHDIPRTAETPAPKTVNQPMYSPNGKPTQNGLFFQAAQRFKVQNGKPERVRVYEKIRPGIWVFNGLFRLVDAWQEAGSGRQVFKFRLELDETERRGTKAVSNDLEHNRIIPTEVKLEVWKRDKGRCVKCGSRDNLHFDHIIPYSKGGSSLIAKNVQLLCARHNLAKRDRIE